MRDTLSIKGSREEKREEKDRNFVFQEVSYGSLERSITLPSVKSRLRSKGKRIKRRAGRHVAELIGIGFRALLGPAAVVGVP